MSNDNPEQDGGSLPREMNLPILAIRNTVIFPVLAFPINVGRDKSLKAVDRAMESDRLMGIVAQTDAKIEDPDTGELHTVGTAVKISSGSMRVLRLPPCLTTSSRPWVWA